MDHLCIFSRPEYNIPDGMGSYILYKKLNKSAEKSWKDLFNKLRIYIALAAAFQHCKDGFKSLVHQKPRSFISSTSVISIGELVELSSIE